MFDVTVVVAGQAGQGVRSAADVLSRVLLRSGYRVFAYPDIMSRIRGGHNFIRVRVSDQVLDSIAPKTNLLLALDQDSVKEHKDEMVERGVMLVDTRDQTVWQHHARLVPIAMTELARRQGAGKEMAGTVGLGAVMRLLGLPIAGLESALRERFQRKGKQAVKLNLACAKAGFAKVSERVMRECPCAIPAIGGQPKRLLLTGNQAVGLGALAAGMRFYAGYPMSPATGIMEYLAARQQEFGLVVEQAEDEIAAVNMVIGAAYAGCRAMTATSGGGFSLMVEGLGMSAMAELPIVVVVCQRPGPATGFPTRTEQAELLFAVNASQDEFPRFVFAPGNAEQAFYSIQQAFALSARFQVPSIVLSDQLVADSLWTVDSLDLGQVEQGAGFADEEWHGMPAFTYRRYAVTENGVSPRLRPGFAEQLVCSMGSEHDETGLASEDVENRVRMQGKRIRKLAGMREVFGRTTAYPGLDEEGIAVCFGSTYGAVREAVDRLQQEHKHVGMLHLGEVWPFPREEVRARLARARQVVTVENNATGQLGRLLRRETRIRPVQEILKYDGRPFSGQDLAARLAEAHHGRVG